MAPPVVLFLLLALSTQAFAAVKLPDAKKGMTFEIEKAFNVDFSTDSNGGCKSHKALITNSYYDSIVALTGALNAIDSVSQITKKSRDHDPIAKKDWLRVRQTYEKVFGVDPWTSAGGLAKEVSPVRKTYDEYLVNLQTKEQENEKEPPKYSIRCGDDFLKWLEPTAPDPREAGKPDAKSFTLAKPRQGTTPFPYGALHGPNLTPQRSLMIRKEWITMKDKTHPICRSAPGLGQIAIFVDYPTGLVVFCRDLLNKKGLVPTLAELKPKVGTNIDIARNALSAFWVHELGHLIKDFQDPAALDADGIPVRDYKGDGTNVYDWEMTVNYAKCRVDDVPSSPECYRMFAVAMYWKDFFWATGKAKTGPEVVMRMDQGRRRRRLEGTGLGHGGESLEMVGW